MQKEIGGNGLRLSQTQIVQHALSIFAYVHQYEKNWSQKMLQS